MTRIYREWCKRIDSRTITYGQCHQFCKAIASDGGGHRTALTASECDDLYRRAEKVWDEGGFDLIGTYQGATWKQAGNGWLARNGARLAISANTGLHGCPNHIELAACYGTLDFRWVGVIDGVFPIFRAITPEGRTFDYYAVPWQRKRYG